MTNMVKRMPLEDIDAFATIVANAYPSIDMATPESRQQFVQRLSDAQRGDQSVQLYGLYRDGKLIGGMRLFDFMMTMFETQVPVGGVGMVAVDLLHKKEHVAKELVLAFLNQYRLRGAPLAALYPFRPDFYRQMGFGYGTKMQRYQVKPANLPPGDKAGVCFLSAEHAPELLACYNRFAARTHGMFQRSQPLFDTTLANRETRCVGYRVDGQLRGYVMFQYRKGKTFVLNDIEVQELIYEDRAALLGLMAFLRTQADQINQIIFHTQDEYFHQLLLDPRNGSDNLMPHAYHESHASGVGLMYRVLDTTGLFHALARHNFSGLTCRLRIDVEDNFTPEVSGPVVIGFEGGWARPLPDEGHDIAISLDVSALSSLVMGTVSFRKLYDYGQAEISEPAYVPFVNRLFQADEKPICMTRF